MRSFRHFLTSPHKDDILSYAHDFLHAHHALLAGEQPWQHPAQAGCPFAREFDSYKIEKHRKAA